MSLNVKKMVSLDNPLRLMYHKARAVIANMVYGYPSQKMTIVGITGTNGKTTTTNLVAKGLRDAGHKVFMFSTINIIMGDDEIVNNTKMTSPDPFVIQKLLKEAKEKGCTIAVIETSSHSILMNRNYGLNYDIAVLTNITQDHLDLHKTMESYVETKLQLFKNLIIYKRKPGVKKVAIINNESDYKDLFVAETFDVLYTYGKSPSSTLKLEDVKYELEGTTFDIKTAGSKQTIVTSLRGDFNIYNIMAAVGVFMAFGMKMDKIKEIVKSIKGVAGRMEEVKNDIGCKIFIDYAHTSDALKQVLNTAKQIEGVNRVITVFGATGDRDRTKRPIMGKVVSDLSDIVILTQDDDYTEKTERIIKDVLPGIERKEGENFWIITDRKEAIRTALLTAEKNDVILIAGKGDEHKMLTNDGPIDWHDKDVVVELLGEMEGVK
ncbi:UDP-N-acetylmuramoyl-L-alanyl-D-glutamate--2,6-diaminopimelate ligase [Candidatus Gracilibacteria bacterium]|nr:UDP-N-acetylmuramoyl-L-alanyl-D-glutamate--2,6-diaminopimelate ligase [Candidatus Gracilibacteria bacterium]